MTTNGYRNWVFTQNNPTSNELPPWDKIKYLVWQRERGAEGTEHLQGYVELQPQQRLSALTKWLPKTHFEPRKGTAEQARAYCMKQDDTYLAGPWERGDFCPPAPGKRTDLLSATATLRDEGYQAVAEQHPAEFVKFYKGFKALEEATRKRRRDEDFTPRKWQAKVLDFLLAPPSDRTIYWVHETRGNVGKSRLAHHLCCEYDAIELHGKASDMAHGYDRQRVVIFDLARTQEDCLKHIYGFAEKLKNGRFYSPKYESGMKLFDPPHVIFFANFAPPSDAWSTDRLVEIDLNAPKWHV